MTLGTSTEEKSSWRESVSGKVHSERLWCPFCFGRPRQQSCLGSRRAARHALRRPLRAVSKCSSLVAPLAPSSPCVALALRGRAWGLRVRWEGVRLQRQARLGRVKRDHEPMAVAAAMTAGARSYHKVKTQHQTGKHAQRAGKDPHAPRIGDPRETRRIWRLPKPTEVRPHDRRVVHRHLGRTFSQHEPKTTGAERIACSQPRTCWDAGKCATFARCRSHAVRA